MNVDVEKIVREYLDKTVHMSLATVSGDRPWVCEVHFVYDDSLNLYFRSQESRRHSQEIAQNSHVAGNIVRQHEVMEYPNAIYFEGTAMLVSNSAQITEIGQYFKDRLNVPDNIAEDAIRENGHKFYEITVEKWYAFGKFGGDKGVKHELVWNGGKKS
jgi:uncharacterized protein YhbP (UPF0306 family)